MAAAPGDTSASSPSPFAAALREAIAARRISLARLHRRLADAGSPVSAATLSFWRSGARRPEGAASLAAVSELEHLLGLAPRSLTSLIGPTRRVGRSRTPGIAMSDEEISAALEETRAQLGTDPQSWLRETSSVNIAVVGANGGAREYTSRALVQATTRVVRAIPIIFRVPLVTEQPDRPEVYAISGGAITAVHQHPSGHLMGARFELDAPVAAPGDFIVEYGIRVPESYPPDRYAVHGVLRASRELVVQVRFPPGIRPAWVQEVEDDEDGELVIPRTMTGSTVHATRRGFGPGSLGIRWGFDGDEPPHAPADAG
ncbi:hypothetical protein [Microbacterium sp. No. 7]|uniref:hypothetical protein n=1 Tax=Microbacterium sp. No. 7 TaxID=1714373 RepID=UPI0006D1B4A4|nr:hypothetical protein [Microbacterium sp. No. 7]ALJ19973.1 hypothetical protein AOA12_08645 [Microbacterium sp. No. 7]